MSSEVTIYALIDPRDGSTRYIGQTLKPLDRRLAEHLGSASSGAKKIAWLNELESLGLQPTISALESVTTSEADAVEARLMREYKDKGAPLTNMHTRPGGALMRQQRSLAAMNEVTIQVRIPTWAHEKLKEWAGRNGTSVSYLARRIARRALDANEDEGEIP